MGCINRSSAWHCNLTSETPVTAMEATPLVPALELGSAVTASTDATAWLLVSIPATSETASTLGMMGTVESPPTMALTTWIVSALAMVVLAILALVERSTMVVAMLDLGLGLVHMASGLVVAMDMATPVLPPTLVVVQHDMATATTSRWSILRRGEVEAETLGLGLFCMHARICKIHKI